MVVSLMALSVGCARPDSPARPSAADEDSRQSFVTPYANVRPDVQYMGDNACGECHLDHAEAYWKHPMSRSLVLMSQAVAQERYDAGAHNPFESGRRRDERCD